MKQMLAAITALGLASSLHAEYKPHYTYNNNGGLTIDYYIDENNNTVMGDPMANRNDTPPPKEEKQLKVSVPNIQVLYNQKRFEGAYAMSEAFLSKQDKKKLPSDVGTLLLKVFRSTIDERLKKYNNGLYSEAETGMYKELDSFGIGDWHMYAILALYSGDCNTCDGSDIRRYINLALKRNHEKASAFFKKNMQQWQKDKYSFK